ncbi:hypothetical protein [Streptomyces sp. H27-D2]|uniref:hypothetical protein n=1 Tax=Streptomyces sp. H27-D2 TaxID=3046304 RepID=UPI002DB62D58|nr:hypothetical protein [Streptomyces sp. H27-D2]MEC4016094.1 hypothetical protein [Streptomyces sp. H27-D2]
MPGPIGRSTVTVLRALLVAGDYNAQVRDWDHATRTPVGRVTIDVTGTTESTQAADQTTTRATAFLPPGAVTVGPFDRVVWSGRIWEVDGHPAAPEGAGVLSGQVVLLLEVTG